MNIASLYWQMDEIKHIRRDFSQNYPYHVISKDGAPKLTDPRILEIIKETLMKASQKMGAVISHYVVLSTHLHAIIETPGNKRGLARAMQYINSQIRVNSLLGRTKDIGQQSLDVFQQ